MKTRKTIEEEPTQSVAYPLDIYLEAVYSIIGGFISEIDRNYAIHEWI